MFPSFHNAQENLKKKKLFGKLLINAVNVNLVKICVKKRILFYCSVFYYGSYKIMNNPICSSYSQVYINDILSLTWLTNFASEMYSIPFARHEWTWNLLVTSSAPSMRGRALKHGEKAGIQPRLRPHVGEYSVRKASTFFSLDVRRGL